jgi:hypothetical protein
MQDTERPVWTFVTDQSRFIEVRSSPMMEGDVRRRGIDSEDERMETESNMVASCYMHGNVPAAALLVIRVQCLLTDCV